MQSPSGNALSLTFGKPRQIGRPGAAEISGDGDASLGCAAREHSRTELSAVEKPAFALWRQKTEAIQGMVHLGSFESQKDDGQRRRLDLPCRSGGVIVQAVQKACRHVRLGGDDDRLCHEMTRAASVYFKTARTPPDISNGNARLNAPTQSSSESPGQGADAVAP